MSINYQMENLLQLGKKIIKPDLIKIKTKGRIMIKLSKKAMDEISRNNRGLYPDQTQSMREIGGCLIILGVVLYLVVEIFASI